MIEHHAFGVTRRSRREEHISEVVGGLDRFQRTCVEAREIKLVDRQSLHGYRPLQPGIQMRLREGHPNFTTLKQKLQALARHGGINGHVGSSSNQHSHYRHDLLPAFFHHHGDWGVRANSRLT